MATTREQRVKAINEFIKDLETIRDSDEEGYMIVFSRGSTKAVGVNILTHCSRGVILKTLTTLADAKPTEYKMAGIEAKLRAGGTPTSEDVEIFLKAMLQDMKMESPVEVPGASLPKSSTN
jgi:hypothetical protein